MPVKTDGADTLKTRPTLLSKVRRGDEDGWSRFYDLYENFIYAAARGAGLAHEESRDVVQEAMVTVRHYIDRFVPDPGRARFRTWLHRIVQSRIADEYRKKKRNPLAHAPKELPDDSATSATQRIPDLSKVDLDRLIDGKLEEAILEESRKRVRERVRLQDYQAYDLFEIHEMSAGDVAISLGINVTTVRVKAFRVRQAVEREARRIAKALDSASSPSPAPPLRSDRLSPPPSALPSIPGYTCIKPIANGGYGYVYLFRRNHKAPVGTRHVAGKFVYRQIFGPADDPASHAAYQRALEGLQNFRTLSGKSPYLLRVDDVRQRHEAGYFCYMMELADDMESGQTIDADSYIPRTLKNELERAGHRRRLAVRDCVQIAITLARGLEVLHESGFTHRDVRPSNIIFVHEVPKLADIDLLAGHDPALTSYIPRDYAAPEGSHSRQADIYSFGKAVYEMCTGLSAKAYPCLPPDIRHWNDHQLLLQLNKVIGNACAAETRQRYGSIKSLLEDLENMA